MMRFSFGKVSQEFSNSFRKTISPCTSLGLLLKPDPEVVTEKYVATYKPALKNFAEFTIKYLRFSQTDLL